MPIIYYNITAVQRTISRWEKADFFGLTGIVYSSDLLRKANRCRPRLH